jgi:hypothetical protein
MRDHGLALEVLGELAAVREAPADWPRYPSAAEEAMRCRGLIQGDKRLSGTDRRRLEQRSTELALTFLRRASECKDGPPPGLFDTPVLAPLRRMPEFQRLREMREPIRVPKP